MFREMTERLDNLNSFDCSSAAQYTIESTIRIEKGRAYILALFGTCRLSIELEHKYHHSLYKVLTLFRKMCSKNGHLKK